MVVLKVRVLTYFCFHQALAAAANAAVSTAKMAPGANAQPQG